MVNDMMGGDYGDEDYGDEDYYGKGRVQENEFEFIFILELQCNLKPVLNALSRMERAKKKISQCC